MSNGIPVSTSNPPSSPLPFLHFHSVLATRAGLTGTHTVATADAVKLFKGVGLPPVGSKICGQLPSPVKCQGTSNYCCSTHSSQDGVFTSDVIGNTRDSVDAKGWR